MAKKPYHSANAYGSTPTMLLDGQCLTHSFAGAYIAGGLIDWVIAAFLTPYLSRSRTMYWFRIFLLAGGLYFVAQGLAGCSATDTAYRLFIGIYQATIPLLLAAFFIFTLYFVNKDYLLSQTWMLMLLTVPGVVLLGLFWQTQLIMVPGLDHAVVTFGFHFPSFGPWSNIAGLYFFAWFAAAIAVMIIYLRHVDDPLKKKEVSLVLISVFITLVPSLFTELLIWVVLRGPHILVGPFTSIIQDLVIFYALTRYGLHIFNLNTIAANIMGVIPGGLIITDHTDTIQYVNAAGAKMLGYSTNHLVGLSLKKMLPSQSAYKEFKAHIFAPLRGDHQTIGHEATFITSTNQPLPVSVNAANSYTGTQLTNHLIAFTDITRLKETQAELMAEKESVEQRVVQRTRELSEAQAELIASVSSLPFGFAIIGQYDQVIFANARLSLLVNRPVSARPGENRAILQTIQADYASVIDILGCVRKTQQDGHPIEKNIALGSRFFRFLFIPVVRDAEGPKPEIIATALLLEDTTEEKALQRSRDEFFSIASHELRTPLTAVRGNASMILEYYKDQLKDPSLKELITDIHEASIRLIDIVNDFLDVSRLEQGRIEFKITPLDAAEVIEKTLREYEVTGSRRHLYLELDPPPAHLPLVSADEARVRQILINLISNGLKYEGGIKIKLEPTSSTIRIHVTDTGKGIPKESQHLLFRKFQQASNNILTRDNTQSTGLGLYISRLMAQGMRGTLKLEWTELGKGSTFVLELPLAPVRAKR
jgi:two-component system phosphate regulon sensor histidine kinase PhoR